MHSTRVKVINEDKDKQQSLSIQEEKEVILKQTKPLIEKIVSKFSKSFNALWYSTSEHISQKIDSENLTLKIKADYHFSPEYCIYKINRILKSLQEEDTLNKDITLGDKYLQSEKDSDEFNYLTVKIPLVAIKTSAKSKLKISSSVQDKSYLPASPYIINIHSSDKRELFVWANPLYGSKMMQKGAIDTCWYQVLNYIRERYKESKDITYTEKRKLEKLWSDFRFEMGRLVINYRQILLYINHAEDIEPIEIDEFSDVEELFDRSIFRYADSTKIYFENFLIFLKSVHVEETIKKEQIIEIMKNFFFSQLAQLQRTFITQKLKLDFDKLKHAFFEARGFNSDRPFEHSLGAYSHIIDYLQKEQLYKLYDIVFSTWTPQKTCRQLLDDIERHGPHVFGINRFIKNQGDKTILASYNGFNIYSLSDLITHQCLHHTILVIGGEMTHQDHEFIYFIDPNDEYSYQKKPPGERSFNCVSIKLSQLQIYTSVKINMQLRNNQRPIVHGLIPFFHNFLTGTVN